MSAPTMSSLDPTPPVTHERKPRSLVIGAELARVLSVLAAVGAVAGGIGAVVYRVHHRFTWLNMSGPIFFLLEVVLVAVVIASYLSARAVARTLADDTGARDQLVGMGAVAAVVALISGVVLLGRGHGLAGAIALVWCAASIASLALLSSPASSRWLEGRLPLLNVVGWIRSNMVAFLGLLVMAFLYIPNVVVAAMSFNSENTKRTVYQWYGFTTSNWTHVCAPQGMCSAVGVSLWIGLVATVLATAIGTLAAFGLVRHRFAGRSSSNIVVFLPMATPEIVMGSSLLAFFVALHQGGHLGAVTIIIAHVMFCLSYVVMTVKARLAGMDRDLEQAAMDLYATPSQTFWKVTFPLVFPGILAAALLAFSLSFDDYIVTNLNAGNTTTFPMYVWGAAQRGLPMQVNVIGTFMFVLAVVIVVTADLVGRGRARGRAR